MTLRRQVEWPGRRTESHAESQEIAIGTSDTENLRGPLFCAFLRMSRKRVFSSPGTVHHSTAMESTKAAKSKPESFHRVLGRSVRQRIPGANLGRENSALTRDTPVSILPVQICSQSFNIPPESPIEMMSHRAVTDKGPYRPNIWSKRRFSKKTGTVIFFYQLTSMEFENVRPPASI
jgi:hypothetical protein